MSENFGEPNSRAKLLLDQICQGSLYTWRTRSRAKATSKEIGWDKPKSIQTIRTTKKSKDVNKNLTATCK